MEATSTVPMTVGSATRLPDTFTPGMAALDPRDTFVLQNGAGQQQVRLVRANVGAFHVCLWTFTMTEAWAWNRAAKGLVEHRSASPWDDAARRPSHADKRRAWRRDS